jgi:hypothetical protein
MELDDDPDVAWISRHDAAALEAAEESATNVCFSEDALEQLLSWWAARTGIREVS